jgi:putative Holliday junction resolvase
MRILGIDYGKRRIGLAISDPSGFMAQPLATIDLKDDNDSIREIVRIINERSVEEVVVGLPVSLSGELGQQARDVLQFIEELRSQTDVNIATWDERLSTSIAQRALTDTKAKKARKKDLVDQIAAAVILQGYLDSRR